MTDEHDSDSVHLTPPLADLSDREAPTPGPLTKPVALPRASQRRRPRLLLAVLVLLVIAAAAAIIWSLTLGPASGDATAYTIAAARLFTA